MKVAVEPVPLQAHVLIEGGITGDSFTFVLWLVHGQGWQVQNLYLGTSPMIGKSSADLWQMAARRARRHHGFDAALLYAAADNLAERGRDFELGFRPQLRTRSPSWSRPAALQGTRLPLPGISAARPTRFWPSGRWASGEALSDGQLADDELEGRPGGRGAQSPADDGFRPGFSRICRCLRRRLHERGGEGERIAATAPSIRSPRRDTKRFTTERKSPSCPP